MLPEDVEPFPGVAVDPLDPQLDVPPLVEEGYLPSSDDDSGEFNPLRFLDPSTDEEEEEDEEEEDWDDEDLHLSSLSEEEDEDEEEEGEEDGQWRFLDLDDRRALPAQAVDPVPQQRAESPSPAFHVRYNIFEDALHAWDHVLVPAVPSASPSPGAPALLVLEESSGSALHLLPSAGSKRSRDEDEEDEDEDPSSKRPRLSSSEDSSDDPSPSTSAGTSGGFPL